MTKTPRGTMSPLSWSARCGEAITRQGTHCCLGVDPHFERLTGWLGEEFARLGPSAFLSRWLSTILEAASGRVAAVKFQSAFFEALGLDGLRQMETAFQEARAKGLLTLLDAKRGDISTTMRAYGSMAFDWLKADALTILPWMGTDTLTSLSPWLCEGRGAYVVLISSNPAGAALQQLTTSEGTRDPLAERVRRLFHDAAKDGGFENGLGFVVGATSFSSLPPELLDHCAEHPLLMPGIGPQGGRMDDQLGRLLSRSNATLIPLSRALTLVGDPAAQSLLDSCRSWEDYGGRVHESINVYADLFARKGPTR